jgi:purine-nucleoside/S-methyl-5'-thioadenosine phosphorylase / adenosine deaminase
VFYKDSQNVYRVRAFEEFAWLVHGFGTRWSADFAPDARLATLHQIHSDRVIVANGQAGRLGEGDALVENTPGSLVAVKTADCIPILIADPRNRAVAAVHAGWRGTAHRIVEQAIRNMEREFSSRPGDLHAAIGPGIGKCCYEVGGEVAALFRTYDPALRDITHAACIDLGAVNRRQIEDLGVPPAQIYMAGLCTRCNQEFHSYRRDKERAGRMLSFAGVR